MSDGRSPRMRAMAAARVVAGDPSPAAPIDTTEVRWFAGGKLPLQAVEYFCAPAAVVSSDVRTDLYRIGTSHDVGTKLRSGETLEIKTRRGEGPVVRLGRNTSGRTEEWRKTFPRERSKPRRPAPGEWCAVDKLVLTRTYGSDQAGGVEPVARDLSIPGCDVQLASVMVKGIYAWTFGLEAWGPSELRHELIRRTVTTFQAEAPIPAELMPQLENAMGYPEWLATFVWSRSSP